MTLALNALWVQNLRGYYDATLDLTHDTTVVVGPNNAGKTSILRMLDWLFKSNPSSFSPSLALSKEDEGFLLPARETKHKARRLTMMIGVSDGRQHGKFKCTNGIASLRLNIRLTPRPLAYLALGPRSRAEKTGTSVNATELLRQLQSEIDFVYIPAFRDVASSRFKNTLERSLSNRIHAKALHSSQGGSHSEYRQIRQGLRKAKEIIKTLVDDVWPETRSQLPPGMARNAKTMIDADPTAFVDWLTSRLTLQVATGEHDSSTVPMADLGSGLQSLMDLAIHHGAAAASGTRRILAVEEPESFLHPSAQRVVARRLFTDSDAKVIITTHSPIVVDEASYGEVIVCHNQQFYSPDGREEDREEINTALLTGAGSEMLFARAVLFVEGEGDRLFFEQLRRRIAAIDTSGRVDQLFTVAIGGKTRFAPWLKLLSSYGAGGIYPIGWLAVGDGDAARDMRDAFRDAGMTLRREITDLVTAVSVAKSRNVDEWTRSIRELNVAARQTSTHLILLPVDLEHAALRQASSAFLTTVANKANIDDGSLAGVLRRLGSKGEDGRTHENSIKSPWIRGFIGMQIPWQDLTDDVKGVLRRWMTASGMTANAAGKLLNDPRLLTVP